MLKIISEKYTALNIRANLWTMRMIIKFCKKASSTGRYLGDFGQAMEKAIKYAEMIQVEYKQSGDVEKSIEKMFSMMEAEYDNDTMAQA